MKPLQNQRMCVTANMNVLLEFSLRAFDFKNMLQERNTVVVALRHSILDFVSPAMKATEHTVIISDEVICHVCQLLHNHLTNGDVLRSIILVYPRRAGGGAKSPDMMMQSMSVRPA